jgi:hypothetical protein
VSDSQGMFVHRIMIMMCEFMACVRVCMCEFMACVCVCANARAYVYLRVCMYIIMYAYIYVLAFRLGDDQTLQTHTCIKHADTHVVIIAYIHPCMFITTHTHTHTHTHHTDTHT